MKALPLPRIAPDDNTNEGDNLELWMRIGQPIEGILGHHQQTFDAWADGGVRGLVIGRMVFMADVPSGLAAEAIPAFTPNQSIYRTLGVEPPSSPPQFPEKRKQLDQLLDDAKARGWTVLIFEPAAFRRRGKVAVQCSISRRNGHTLRGPRTRWRRFLR